MDTSDELLDVEMDINDKFIADCAREAAIEKQKRDSLAENGEQSHKLKAQEMIKQAEASRVQILATPGNNDLQVPNLITGNLNALQHSTIVDERYIVMGRTVDLVLRDKIKRGEYVDLARLLPRDHPTYDDNRLELINRGGQTFFVPAGEHEYSLAITNFTKWDLAFRVYSNIYLQTHPQKATELLQYAHIIYTASLSFIWENVYTYDKEFRNHLAMFPDCSWAIILQQAWSMCLKDWVTQNFGNGGGNKSGGNGFCKKEACKRFNKGLCTAGKACKYDHKCLESGKFSHGAHICHRRLSQAQGQSDQPSTSASTNQSSNSASK